MFVMMMMMRPASKVLWNDVNNLLLTSFANCTTIDAAESIKNLRWVDFITDFAVHFIVN